MRTVLARIRDLFRRRAIGRDFDEEMSFHLAGLEEQFRAGGASPVEAREAAVREFGNVPQAREALRDRAGFPSWDELAGDGKHAWRGVVRRPWLAGSVVLIMALGLGSAATIYGLIDAVFLRPLPVPHPEQLFAVVSAAANLPDRLSRGTVRRLAATLPEHSVAAYGGGARCTVQIGGRAATRANTRLVNGGFFSTLGVRPGAGRLLDEADDVLGSPNGVVVVSTAWAKANFGSAGAAVGAQLTANRTPVTIVGVLPAKFREVSVGQTTELWFAAAMQPRLRIFGNASVSMGDDRPDDPDWNREERISWLQILVRVRPGDPAVAPVLQRAWEPQRDDLIRTHEDAGEREQLNHSTWELIPAPGGQSRLRQSFRSTGWLLSGVVGVMLVLVCSNVSGLLLVRSMSRHREIGVRLALGAGSFRVMRLGFFEAVILSVAGGLTGWLLATWLLPAAVHLLAPGQDLEVALGIRSIVLMSGLALLCAGLSALAPSLWISRVQPLHALSGNRGLGRAPVRLGRILVVAQFAIAVGLVTLATALGGELQRVLAADPGFERDQVVTAVFDAPSAGYEVPAIPTLVDRLRNAALGVPGVSGVSFSASGILAGSESTSGVYFRDPHARVRERSFQHDSVMPGFFGVVGIPLLAGRDFADSDKAGVQPVAVVNEAFARAVFGRANPIGQSFGFDVQPTKEDRVIVGVVADVHVNGVRGAAPPFFYTPSAQWADEIPEFMAVRFAGPEAAVQESLRSTLARVEPGLVMSSWKTLEQRMADDVRGDVATTRLAAIFGVCAVLLASAGVAGSLGYLVVLRQRELALRLAIGAAPGRVFRDVLVDALRLGGLGGLLGIVAVWLLPHVPGVRGILAVQPGIMPALVAAAVALAAASLAGMIPARRAARIDPIRILKLE